MTKKFIKILLFISIFSTALLAKNLNMDHELEKAKKQNKNLLIFFNMNHCPYCEKMLKENFKNKKTIEYIDKNFILVKINIDHKENIKYNNLIKTKKEFSKYLGTKVVPATIFINRQNKVIHKTIGYRNIKEFLTELKYIGTKSYKTTNLETFTEELEFNEDE